mmetsp:Transcript_7738/g.10777  ORF Transcript_7738/g.10777 Transcript_7738/m.10777 type:complete len:153 (+) Transcript_7738:439-897(+)
MFEEERRGWVREHAKLTSIIDLQQQELQNRGHRADQQIEKLTSRIEQIESSVSKELCAIRQLLADSLLPQQSCVVDRLNSMQLEFHQFKSSLFIASPPPSLESSLYNTSPSDALSPVETAASSSPPRPQPLTVQPHPEAAESWVSSCVVRDG